MLIPKDINTGYQDLWMVYTKLGIKRLITVNENKREKNLV